MEFGLHRRRISAVVEPFSDPSPNPPETLLNTVLPRFRRQVGRGKVGAIARCEDCLMNRTPGKCKKVTLDWHADHDVYKKHQFNEIQLQGDTGVKLPSRNKFKDFRDLQCTMKATWKNMATTQQIRN